MVRVAIGLLTFCFKYIFDSGVLKRKKSSSLDYAVKAAPTNGDTLQLRSLTSVAPLLRG